MKAYVFPGQGAQFPGMGMDLYEASNDAKEMFEEANKILGFSMTGISIPESNSSNKSENILFSVLLQYNNICDA